MYNLKMVSADWNDNYIHTDIKHLSLGLISCNAARFTICFAWKLLCINETHQNFVYSKPVMTYHTQGESQHTIFRTLFPISNDVQHPKLAIQWRILIKSALNRDGWLKIASTLARGKAFSWQILQASIPRDFEVIFRHALFGGCYLSAGNH